MIYFESDKSAKGWFAGPWNSKLEIAVGYANQGINEKHYHSDMNEVYLVAKGESLAEVEGKQVKLKVGDILVVEPGEKHTFVSSSEDYFYFVIHTPFKKGDKTLLN